MAVSQPEKDTASRLLLLTSLVALGILVAVLMIRPNGLFASARMRRV